MSPREKLFARNLVKNRGDATQGYMETWTGSSRQSAAVSASRLLTQKPEILTYVQKVMDANGLTVDCLAKKLKKKLDSTKPLIVDKDVIYIEDNQSQLRATELAMRAQGMIQEGTFINNSKSEIMLDNSKSLVLTGLESQINKLLSVFNIDSTESQPCTTDCPHDNTPESKIMLDNKKVDIAPDT